MVRRKELFVRFDVMVMVLVVAVAASLFGCSSGCSSGCPSSVCPPSVQYQVGDSNWSIPPYPNYFTNWTSSHFFRTGDFLRFEFETGFNDVIQVSRQEYESCTACNPFKVLKNGPAIVPLTEEGVLYFVSNVSNYCSLGLKISIRVHRCSAGIISPPTPSPSQFPVPTPPSSPTNRSAAPPRGTGERSNPPAPRISPAPSPDSHSPGPGAPTDQSMAPVLGRFGIGSSGILSGWAFGLCLVVFIILG